VAETKTMSQRADELEHQQLDEFDRIITKSALFNMADGKIGADFRRARSFTWATIRASPRCRKSRP